MSRSNATSVCVYVADIADLNTQNRHGPASGLPGLTDFPSVKNGSFEPCATDAVNADIADSGFSSDSDARLGITDGNQLITHYTIAGAVDGGEAARAGFNVGIDKLIQRQSDCLVFKCDIDSILVQSAGIEPSSSSCDLSNALQASGFSSEAALLLVPTVADDAQLSRMLRRGLGSLVSDREIDAIIASVGECDATDVSGARRSALMVDVTPLCAAVLERFQVLLNTWPTVIVAERALILAQAALIECVKKQDRQRANGKAQSRSAKLSPADELEGLCNAVENAGEQLAQALVDTYQRLTDERGPLPTPYLEQTAAELKHNILKIAVGMSASQIADETAIEIAHRGAGKVVQLAQNPAIGHLSDTGNSTTTLSDQTLWQTDQVVITIDELKRARYADYPELQTLKYASIVRIEKSVGIDRLAEFNRSLLESPTLGPAMDANPSLANVWRLVDRVCQEKCGNGCVLQDRGNGVTS